VLIEGYIALILLALLLVAVVVMWADGIIQNARREQRRRQLGR
jgi:type II secretory pathway component PulJ